MPLGVTLDARSRCVHAGFVASAAWYDRLTRVFSFSLDGRWRRACLRWCDLRPGQTLLDVATGTGELAIQARRALGDGVVTVGLDFCEAMLGEGEAACGVEHARPLGQGEPARVASGP